MGYEIYYCIDCNRKIKHRGRCLACNIQAKERREAQDRKYSASHKQVYEKKYGQKVVIASHKPNNGINWKQVEERANQWKADREKEDRERDEWLDDLDDDEGEDDDGDSYMEPDSETAPIMNTSETSSKTEYSNGVLFLIFLIIFGVLFGLYKLVTQFNKILLSPPIFFLFILGCIVLFVVVVIIIRFVKKH